MEDFGGEDIKVSSSSQKKISGSKDGCDESVRGGAFEQTLSY